jgi:hypothetical protein
MCFSQGKFALGETYKMSRGPGRVQQKISEAIAADPDLAYDIEELCSLVYPGINRAEKRHRVAVDRALKRLKLKPEKAPTLKQQAKARGIGERTLRMGEELAWTGRLDLREAILRGEMTPHRALTIAKPESYGRARRRPNKLSSIDYRIADFHLRATDEERRAFQKMLSDVYQSEFEQLADEAQQERYKEQLLGAAHGIDPETGEFAEG